MSPLSREWWQLVNSIIDDPSSSCSTMTYKSRPVEVVVYDAGDPDGPFSDAAMKLRLDLDSSDPYLTLRYGDTQIPTSVEELELLAAAAKQLMRGEAA
jgi:hypothetical protein